MAFEFGCEWHSALVLWHLETSRWLWGTVARQCNWLLSKHERLVALVKSKLMMVMMKEMMNTIDFVLLCCCFCEKTTETRREIGKCGSTLSSIDLLSCFGVGPICLMVTQRAFDWRLDGTPGPLPCYAGIEASWRRGVFESLQTRGGGQEKKKQVLLLYLDQQLELLNIWPVWSEVSRPQVKKSMW